MARTAFVLARFDKTGDALLQGIALRLDGSGAKQNWKLAFSPSIDGGYWSALAIADDMLERPIIVAGDDNHGVHIVNGESGTVLGTDVVPGHTTRALLVSGGRGRLIAFVAHTSGASDPNRQGGLYRLVIQNNGLTYAFSRRHLQSVAVGDVVRTGSGLAILLYEDDGVRLTAID